MVTVPTLAAYTYTRTFSIVIGARLAEDGYVMYKELMAGNS